MKRVLTTSTGEPTRVAMNPAPVADKKWQGIESERSCEARIFSLITSYVTSSQQLMIAFRAMLGDVPGKGAKKKVSKNIFKQVN